MNEEIKYIWIDALTSGEYQQTTYRLNDENGYCCLGVLCDLYRKITGKGNWNKWMDEWRERYHFIDGKGEIRSGSLSRDVKEWAGLKNDGECTDLSNLNDHGNSFMKIAKVIANY